MSFDWKEYLLLADALALTKTEACFRAAISRAYYAGFCLARNRARQEGLIVGDKDNVHEKVEQHYSLSALETYQEIGLRLSRLRGRRNRADYNDTIQRPDSLCEASLIEAHELLNYLTKI